MMKILTLQLYGDAGEAEALCELLEALRMAILHEYGDAIRQMHLEIQPEANDATPNQQPSDWPDNEPPF